MGLDTSYQYDGADTPDTGSDMSTSDGYSPGVQAGMSAGLDDYDDAADTQNTAPGDPGNLPVKTPPAPGTPAAPGTTPDQPTDPTSIQPHIGGKIENDINKEAEHQPVWPPKGETETPSPEPPEGYHPGGPEGGW